MPAARSHSDASTSKHRTASVHTDPSRYRIDHVVTLFAWLFLVVVFLTFFKIAWVTEDAYITHRSIEQLFEGNGPRWNPHERVQAFTSPLWFWYLALFRVFSANVFVNTIIASALLLVPMLFLVRATLRDDGRWLVAMAAMVCSVGFFDYTTSGLENILAYTLLSVFLLFGFRVYEREVTRKRDLVALLFTVGLLAVCRHDLVTLLAIPLAAVVWKKRAVLSWPEWLMWGLLAALPLLAWSAFSIVYYGALFPNTAYAKLSTGVPRSDLIAQGVRYVQVAIRRDTITIAVVVLAGGWLLLDGSWWRRALGAGIFANIAYVIAIGGDFMLGRFFSFAFLVALVAAVRAIDPGGNGSGPLAARRWRILVPLALCLVYAFAYQHTPVNSPQVYRAEGPHLYGVADERGAYARASFMRYLRKRPPVYPDHHWATEGFADSRSGKEYEERVAVGYYGYWAGTGIKIVDPLAITDPLLARLPIDSRVPWRPGHFPRSIPEGYRESVMYDSNEIFDEGLRAYHRQLKLVTEARLDAPGRFRAIVALNTGGYDHLLEKVRDKLQRGED